MSTKRERLLDWIRNGDPENVPVLLGPDSFEIASSKLCKDQREITWTEATSVAEKTGTHLLACVGSPSLFEAIPFLDNVKLERKHEKLPDGVSRESMFITTPEGTLTEVKDFSNKLGEFHREFLVKDESDMPAFAYMIRKTTEAFIKNPAIHKEIGDNISAVKKEIDGQFPTLYWPFIAGVELTSAGFMGQMAAIYLLNDQADIMEELMDRHWEMTQTCLEISEKHDIDLYGYAINGYEWLSPAIYERYMIPQATKLNDKVSAMGKLSWLHTCGKMKKIADAGIYQQIGIDILESLSMPPTGDIEDMRETRSLIGDKIVTRGGINCELFYSGDLDAIRERTEYVLDSVKGYKHMIGDTNSSFPSYPWENIQTVINVVRDQGRMFE